MIETATRSAKKERPNLLVIMADQLRHDWLGVAGTEGVSTPNIDALAAQGMYFTHAFTNAALCAPARIALATGLRPSRFVAQDNDATLPSGLTTYYQRLRDHDYRVGVVGKLDLAKTDSYNGRKGDRPIVYQWGFTHPLETEGKMHAAGQFQGRPLGPYGCWLEERGLFQKFADDYENRLVEMRRSLRDENVAPYSGEGIYRDSVLPPDAFEDRWLGRRAVEWIREIPDDFPWHLFVSFVGPHDPYDPPAESANRFREVKVPEPIPAGSVGKPGNVFPSRWAFESDQVACIRRQYSAALSIIDEQIGEICRALADRGFDSNTFVVFTSDHGEMLGDHGLFQKNVPYEAAMRVPLVMAGPTIEQGVSHALIELADLNPTLCALAGLDTQLGLDARSFVHLLDEHDQSHRSVAVCSQSHYVAIRSSSHKYINNLGTHRLSKPNDIDEVYNLDDDPDEQRNLYLEDPLLAEAIRIDLEEKARLG